MPSDSDNVYAGRASGRAVLTSEARRLGYGLASGPLAMDELRLATAICQHETGCLVCVHYNLNRIAPGRGYVLAPLVTFDPGRAGPKALLRSSIAAELPNLRNWRGPAYPAWTSGWPLYALLRCMETGAYSALGSFSIGLNQIQLGAHIGGSFRGPTNPWRSGSEFAAWWRSQSATYDAIIPLALNYITAIIRGPSGRMPAFSVGEAASLTAQRVMSQTGGGMAVALPFVHSLNI